MSRDSSAESLESILASIRRSLSEQATSALEEEAAVPAELLPAAEPIPDDPRPDDLDMPPFPASLSQPAIAPEPSLPSDAPHAVATGPAKEAGPIAAAPAPDAQTGAAAAPSVRTPVLTLVPPPAAAAPVAEPQQMAAPVVPVAPSLAVTSAEAHAAPFAPVAASLAAPLKEAVTAGASEPAAVPAAAPAPAWEPHWRPGQLPASSAPEPKPAPRTPEPRPSRLGAVRGPLPPFFGSSAEEVVKVEMAPGRPARSHEGAMPPLTPPASPFPPPLDPPLPPPLDERRTGTGDPPWLADSAGSARTSAIFDSQPANAGGTAAGGEAQPPQIQALEAMVADLLRPMLRRWLDENMPRLVSAALKAEAELMARREPGRDPKKP